MKKSIMVICFLDLYHNNATNMYTHSLYAYELNEYYIDNSKWSSLCLAMKILNYSTRDKWEDFTAEK